eukprot:gnl/MRDRNA2_/MRDRNA2_172938_c0_seq1.p1 gnl/MRDRNA2_/MRDRNA2_172938_c0~~gnl/MRDRNA2_/MRDRNA2_172938_c0_seq1.p1  ORF type:complete len:663 (-),score=110.69 gnl/MRDRNA2_/MRDRNA2_172938_c0_seq1:36-1970(-)
MAPAISSFIRGKEGSVIFSTSLALCTGFLVKKLVTAWTQSSSCFGRDHRRPRGEHPSEVERNAQLRIGFSKKLYQKLIADKGVFDVVLIGSGISSLICAAILSRSGKRCLVLEQHDMAGGSCHTYAVNGFEWDVGIHYVGEQGLNTLPKVILEQLTDGQIVWQDLQPNYDVAVIGDGNGKIDRFPIPHGLKQLEAMIAEKFPSEKAGIRRFFRDCKYNADNLSLSIIAKILPVKLLFFLKPLLELISHGFYARWAMPLTPALESVTSNKQLQGLLSYHWGDLGTIPELMPYGIMLGLHRHFTEGGFYPLGSAAIIPYHLIKTIQKAGGSVLVRATVDRLVMTGKTCSGLVLEKYPDMIIEAKDAIVSSANAFKTQALVEKSQGKKDGQANHGGSPENAAASLHIPPVLASGVGAVSLFVGLEGSAAELGVSHEMANYWYFKNPDHDANMKEWMALSPEDIIAQKRDIPGIFVGFPSVKDPLWQKRHPKKTTVTVITFADWSWFKDHENERIHHRSEAYQKLKKVIADRMWVWTLELFPQLKTATIGHFEAGTPLSTNFYIGSCKGEIYGADHTVDRFKLENYAKLRADTEFNKLFLTGQDTVCGGFTGGLFAGVLTAGSVLGSKVAPILGGIRSGFRDYKDFKL